jgi:hypothetical protein
LECISGDLHDWRAVRQPEPLDLSWIGHPGP